MTFHEDWFSHDQCLFFADLAATACGDGRIVEVGCWEGKSTVALANAVYPEIVHAVDTWAGSPGEISRELAKTRDVFAVFKANIAELTKGNVEIHRMDWRDYFAADSSPIKFCHIDATHTYEEVRDNINAAWPLIVDGGILCGDDATFEEVRRAAIDTLGFDDGRVFHNLWYYNKGEQPAQRGRVGRYHQTCHTSSDINEHLPTLVELAVELDAKKIIELGTRGGISTVAWLYAADRTDGHVWSVDLNPGPALEDERWTFVQGDDCDITTIRALPDDVDIVFIDSSHMYDHTLAELNIYSLKLRPGGAFVLHDTAVPRPIGWDRNQPNYPVRSAVEQFCADEGFTPEFFDNNNGLGIIRGVNRG